MVIKSNNNQLEIKEIIKFLLQEKIISINRWNENKNLYLNLYKKEGLENNKYRIKINKWQEFTEQKDNKMKWNNSEFYIN